MDKIKTSRYQAKTNAGYGTQRQIDREPDGELKVDLDGKLVVPNIIELTCIQPDTVLVFQQSKTLVAIQLTASLKEKL